MARRIFAIIAVAFVFAAIFAPLAPLAQLGAQDKAAGLEIALRLKGHTDAVYAVAFSPDGRYVATASFDNTLKLWDAATGKEIKTYGGTLGHTKQVISLAFSPDGTMLASGSTDNTLKVWDVPVNVPIRSLKSNDAVSAVALSPDGTKLAVAGKDGSLRLVASADFKDLVKFEAAHQGPITGLAFTANGQTIASVGADRTLRYWNALTGQLISTVGAHTAAINAVAINPGAAAAYTVGDDGALKLWSLPATASKTVPAAAAPIRAMTLAPDNASYYVGGDDKTVRQFAIAAAKESRALTGPTAAISSTCVHPQNTFVAAGTADKTIFLWNNTDPKTPLHWLAHAGAVGSVQVNPQGTQLMSAGADGLIKFWALPMIAPRAFTHPDAVLATASSPDAKKLYTGSADKLVRVWDAGKQTMEKQFAGHTAAVTAVAVSPNLQVLASGGADHTVRLWNQATAKESDVLLAHTAPISALQISPAGTQMLSASEDGSVKLWALPMVQPKSFMHADAVAALALSSDAGKMLTAGNDKIVRLWNLASGAKEKDLAGPTMPITSIASAGNGATIAAASADKTVTLWNAADAKVLQKLPLATQAIAFAVDGQSIFIGLGDGAIKQIKNADGKEIKSLAAQQKGPIVAIVLSPKGDMLFSAADKSIQAWALPDGTAKTKFTHAGPIAAIALSKDGTRIAAAAEKSVKVWTVADGKEIAALQLPAEAKSISLSPDGSRLVAAGADKSARVYDLAAKTLLEILPHDGAVQAALFVDAKKIVTGGSDKLAKLWTSSLLWQRQHQGPVRQAIFTPKGDQVISAGDDKAIKIWSAADGKEIKSLLNESPIAHLSVNADGSKLATAGADKNVKIWTLADGKASVAVALPAAAQGLSLSPNGQRIAVALPEGSASVLRVHDLALGKDVQIFTEHAGPVKSLQFFSDGRTLTSASADKTARIFTVGVASALAAHPAGPTFAQYHPSGQQLISAGADKTVKLWDLTKGAAIKSFGPVADPIKTIALSKDFTKVGVAAGKTVRVFALADGKESAPLNHAAEVLSLSFSPDGTRIATGSADKQTRIWDAAIGKELQFFAHDEPVDAVIYAPANNLVLSAAGKSARLDTTSILRAIQADTGPTYALALVPANTHLLTGGADKIAKLWNLNTGALDRSFAGAGGTVRGVAASKNGQLVAVGGADQTVRVYQYADAKELGSAKAAGEIRMLAFTPNSLALVGSTAGKTLEAWSVPFTPGQPPAKDFMTPVQSFSTADLIADFGIAADNASIFSAGQDKAMHVWKLASPVPTRNFNYGVNVDAVAFQPGSTILAGSGHDGKIRFFDLVKNAQVKDITAHVREMNKQQVPQPIYSLTFSADGKKMLSASYDGSLKLWDAGAGTLIKEFNAYKEKEFEKGHQEPVYAAAMSPDGKFIASGSSGLERTIKIWNIDGSVLRDLANPNFKTAPGFPPQSHPGGITGLVFSKDGKRLISAGDAPGNKGFLAIWDWQAGKLLYDHTALHGVYYGLAVSPDEKLIAIGAGNRDRKFASPEFNTAYLFKMPVIGK